LSFYPTNFYLSQVHKILFPAEVEKSIKLNEKHKSKLFFKYNISIKSTCDDRTRESNRNGQLPRSQLGKKSTCQKHQQEPFDHFMYGLTC